MLSVLFRFIRYFDFDLRMDFLKRLHLLVVLFIDNCEALAFVL